jgi:hypothetical protein
LGDRIHGKRCQVTVSDEEGNLVSPHSLPPMITDQHGYEQ